METQNEKKPKVITIRNLGQGTHIFGAAHVHPNGDTTKPCICISPLRELGPRGAANDRVEMSVDQFRIYEDDALKAKVESREFAVLVDGQDIRPELARRDAAREAAQSARPNTPPTASAASVESSVLADILAEGEQKSE